MKSLISCLILVASILHFANAQSCLPEGLVIEHQDDIDAFKLAYPDCTILQGDLTFLSPFPPDATNPDFSNTILAEVEGDIFFDNIMLLEEYGPINLGNITKVDGEVFIQNSIDFMVEGSLDTILGNFHVKTSNIKEISFPNLIYCDTFFSDIVTWKDIDFPALEEADIDIRSSRINGKLDFPSLKKGNINFNLVDSLININLPSLSQSSTISVFFCKQTESIDFPSVTKLEQLIVEGNFKLSSLNFSLLYTFPEAELNRNDILPCYGFPSVEEFTGSIEFTENIGLNEDCDLDWLCKAQTAGVDIIFEYNEPFHSLDEILCPIDSTCAEQLCGCDVTEVQSNTVKSLDTIVGTVVNVATTSEFWSAINSANSSGGNMTILIEDGTYAVASTSSYPYITASNLVIRSASGNRDGVILTGQGMQDVNPQTENILSLQGDNVIISDLTLRNCGNHAISISSDNHIIHNVRIQNTFEQMIKGNAPTSANNSTIVQCCLLEYTAGVGPQWYIGGLDIHEGTNWLVRDNVFYDIASPSQAVAEHAVHFWDNSAFNTVERNVIVGCDRGIGFGLGSSPNEGGVIRNNMIVNDGSQPYHDVGIGLETSPNTEVYNNTIHVAHQNSIEYRFVATTNVQITNNLTNRPITSRNGGTAVLTTNYEEAETDWYVEAAAGNLRLTESFPEVVDQGTDLTGLCDEDIDQTIRPQGTAYDIGAYEVLATIVVDADNDGYPEDVDCDDMNAEINPGAEEIVYNGIDDDCDASTLDDDLDQDGFDLANDCDDMNGDINPDAEEVVYNGIDDDCDESTLDDDIDQDGFVLADDCDDMNADINPDAEDIPNNGIDEDCDGEDLIVGVLDFEGIAVKIYPNPTTDFMYIDCEESINLSYKIYTNSGQLLTHSTNSSVIDLRNMDAGLYLLELENIATGESRVERIVKY